MIDRRQRLDPRLLVTYVLVSIPVLLLVPASACADK